MTTKLTNGIIAKLPVPATGNKITYDSEETGLGIRVTAAGDRRFIFNYRRKADGRERRYTIGPFPTLEIGHARAKARELRRRVIDGGDPLGQLQETRSAPTVSDLCERFIAEHLPRKRAWTAQSYKRTITADILPTLGSHKLAAVTFADVDKLHRSISKRAPVAANRTLAILSKMFNLAIKWGMRADNPCKGVERNTEDKRSRYLSGNELQRLITALERCANQQAANAIRLLLLTGARKNEVLSAKWDQFDLGTRIWVKPASATKQKLMHCVPLSEPALELLRSLPRRGDYVFPAGRSDATRENLNNIGGAWASICRNAGISDLRIHDLRHHFASVLASSGASLPLIGQLLAIHSPRLRHAMRICLTTRSARPRKRRRCSSPAGEGDRARR
jgi:integrase